MRKIIVFFFFELFGLLTTCATWCETSLSAYLIYEAICEVHVWDHAFHPVVIASLEYRRDMLICTMYSSSCHISLPCTLSVRKYSSKEQMYLDVFQCQIYPFLYISPTSISGQREYFQNEGVPRIANLMGAGGTSTVQVGGPDINDDSGDT